MPELELACPATPNETGAYRLSWTGPAGSDFRLSEGAGSTPRAIYEGPDLASTVTGRTAGRYTYRVEALAADGNATAASTSCVVEVSPPPLSLALGLFGLGLALCIATVALIVRGHRRHRRGELG